MVSCTSGSGPDTASSSVGDTAAPVIESAVVTPNPNSTLSAVVELTTDVPSDASVVVSGPGVEATIPSPEDSATAHEIPVVGLRADSDYELTLGATAEGKSSTERTESFTTGPLPSDLPEMYVVANDVDRRAPGYVLFDVTGVPPEDDPDATTWNYAIALDEEAEVVWYHRAIGGIGDIRQLPSGNFLYLYGHGGAREIDVLGNVLREWDARSTQQAPDVSADALPVATDAMHHEVGMLPNGNLLAIGSRFIEVGPFDEPICGDEVGFAGSYPLQDDVILEIDSDTGDVVHEWPMGELIDPMSDPERFICGARVGGIGIELYPDAEGIRSWTHVNSVVLDEDRNAIVVSARAPNLVMAFRYEDDDEGPSGEVLWTISPEGEAELAPGADPPYQQHAPEIQDDGTILLFDNGNDRPGVRIVDLYSRAVVYDVDDSDLDNVTVEQLWEFRTTSESGPEYSGAVGDADRLPNGNVLIDAGYAPPPRIYEVVPNDGPSGGDVVFELMVADPNGVYRAEHLDTLTPWE